MRKLTLIIIIITLALSSCSDNVFNINVNIDNAIGKKVYLQRVIEGQTVNIDSASVNDNKVTFEIPISENLDAYHIYVKGWRRAIAFFPDNQDITLTGDFNKYNQFKIESPSLTQASLEEFTKKFNELENEDEQQFFVFETVWDKPASVLSPYILYRYKWAFELCELREIVNNFSAELNSGYLDLIKGYIKLLEKTDIGKPYLDFTLKNLDDQDFSLSSMIGKSKLVMIDFWASWCPDCRVENPNIVAVYKDFHEKGLEIISVSLDTDKTAWIKGIEDDNLIWKNHVSDLKGWNCTASQEYGIAFIPQNVLIDANGSIIAKNLNGESLRMFVEDYLK
ncbi:MAG: AhpC/TSA family protein [Lentimicrobiaceae bacterium]|nr:AhpC/TSA family protein [Lentimicrobiaceae bacterium]